MKLPLCKILISLIAPSIHSLPVGRIPEETVKQILDATDIVDLIGSYFPLKRAGGDYKCNCPFHNEKTPSFNISPVKQFYHCFGCKESGNAISFVMNYENVPFTEAVQKLANRAGITIIEDVFDPEADKIRRRISRVKELNNKTARYYHQLLLKSPDAEHAREYLKSRGFSKETAEKWLIGWAPRNSAKFFQLVKEKGFNGREILQARLGGLRDKNNPRSGLYAKFYDQLTFPINNDYGDVVGFSARVLRADDKRGKYINTSDSPLFQKSKLLFGLDKARKHMGKEKFALICEGQIDTIVLHEAGFENTISALGTAFTEEHARMLKRYADRVVLCYDGDSAGITAADKAFRNLTALGIPVKLMHLPAGDDPDTFIKTHGAEKFRELLESAKDFLDAKLDKELPTINLSSASERAALLKRLAELVAVMSDELVRDASIQNLAIRLRMGADEFRQAVSAAKNTPAYSNAYKKEDAKPQQIEASALDRSIGYLCHLAMNSGDAAEFLCEQLESLDECLDHFAGSQILRTILARRPDPESVSARQAFLMTLPEPDQRALIPGLTESPPADPVSSASDTVALVLAKYYQGQESALRSKLNDPNLSSAEIFESLEEAKRLQTILKQLDQRF
ncbi:DNA primase [Verrucomicrobiaceae bacterium 227]